MLLTTSYQNQNPSFHQNGPLGPLPVTVASQVKVYFGAHACDISKKHTRKIWKKNKRKIKERNFKSHRLFLDDSPTFFFVGMILLFPHEVTNHALIKRLVRGPSLHYDLRIILQCFHAETSHSIFFDKTSTVLGEKVRGVLGDLKYVSYPWRLLGVKFLSPSIDESPRFIFGPDVHEDAKSTISLYFHRIVYIYMYIYIPTISWLIFMAPFVDKKDFIYQNISGLVESIHWRVESLGPWKKAIARWNVVEPLSFSMGGQLPSDLLTTQMEVTF